jgi:hypothetical protein
MLKHYDTPEMYAEKVIRSMAGHSVIETDRTNLLERSPEMTEGSEFEFMLKEILLDQGVLMYEHPTNGTIYFIHLQGPIREASMIK